MDELYITVDDLYRQQYKAFASNMFNGLQELLEQVSRNREDPLREAKENYLMMHHHKSIKIQQRMREFHEDEFFKLVVGSKIEEVDEQHSLSVQTHECVEKKIVANKKMGTEVGVKEELKKEIEEIVEQREIAETRLSWADEMEQVEIDQEEVIQSSQEISTEKSYASIASLPPPQPKQVNTTTAVISQDYEQSSDYSYSCHYVYNNDGERIYVQRIDTAKFRFAQWLAESRGISVESITSLEVNGGLMEKIYQAIKQFDITQLNVDEAVLNWYNELNRNSY
jgi:hypothetical protein